MENRFNNFSERCCDANNTAFLRSARSMDVDIPDCINDDFCVPQPRDRNDGILTMAFVDMQPLESVYPPETAFCNGTLFPNLNKPFYGGMRR